MTGRRLAIISAVFCVVCCGQDSASADTSKDEMPPSVWIVEFGGYGVFEPTYLGSRYYGLSFKPEVSIRKEGDKEWLSFPNDALDYSLYETDNFRAGPAANLSLVSPLHGQDIDLRLGKANVTLQGGAFAEYYPVDAVRTRAELLQGIAGNSGLLLNLSADYIWRPRADWTLTFGPRAQVVNDQYASEYVSSQIAYRNNNNYVPYRVEGGLLTSGAELTSRYDVTAQMTAKLFIDYTQLVGDAADNPRVSLRGSPEQVTLGVGATYKFTAQP